MLHYNTLHVTLVFCYSITKASDYYYLLLLFLSYRSTCWHFNSVSRVKFYRA